MPLISTIHLAAVSAGFKTARDIDSFVAGWQTAQDGGQNDPNESLAYRKGYEAGWNKLGSDPLSLSANPPPHNIQGIDHTGAPVSFKAGSDGGVEKKSAAKHVPVGTQIKTSTDDGERQFLIDDNLIHQHASMVIPKVVQTGGTGVQSPTGQGGNEPGTLNLGHIGNMLAVSRKNGVEPTVKFHKPQGDASMVGEPQKAANSGDIGTGADQKDTGNRGAALSADADVIALSADGTHEFSSTQVDMPEHIAAKVKAMARRIPDEHLADDGRAEGGGHVTALYGLHSPSSNSVRETVAAHPPVKMRFGKTSIFPANDKHDYDVVKADVESPDLHALNGKLCEHPHTSSFPDYHPHMTIGTVKAGLGKLYAGMDDLDGMEATANAVTFSSKDGTRTSLPLNGVKTIPQTIGTADGNPDVDASIRKPLGKQAIAAAADTSARGWMLDASPLAPPSPVPMGLAGLAMHEEVPSDEVIGKNPDGTPRFGTRQVPVAYYDKEIARIGHWTHRAARDEMTGDPIEFDINDADAKQLLDNYKALRKNGVTPHIPNWHEHAWNRKINNGQVIDLNRRGDSLIGRLKLVGSDAIEKALKNDVSVYILNGDAEKVVDAKGNAYRGKVLAHVCLTGNPCLPLDDKWTPVPNVARIAASADGEAYSVPVYLPAGMERPLALGGDNQPRDYHGRWTSIGGAEVGMDDEHGNETRRVVAGPKHLIGKTAAEVEAHGAAPTKEKVTKKGATYHKIQRDAKGAYVGTVGDDGNLVNVPEHGERIKASGAPPGNTQAYLNKNPDDHENPQVTTVDRNGKTQPLYSAQHNVLSSNAKWEHEKKLNAHWPAIAEKLKNDPTEEGAALRLIAHTGLRIGGKEGSTDADEPAYGATTLEKEHVSHNGGKATLNFVGKHAVPITHELGEGAPHSEVISRSAHAKPGEKLYNTTDVKTRSAWKKITGDPESKVKDLRTRMAGIEAARAVKATAAPSDAKGYEAAVKQVAEHVSGRLGNTPNVALEKYINPDHFQPFRTKLANTEQAGLIKGYAKAKGIDEGAAAKEWIGKYGSDYRNNFNERLAVKPGRVGALDPSRFGNLPAEPGRGKPSGRAAVGDGSSGERARRGGAGEGRVGISRSAKLRAGIPDSLFASGDLPRSQRLRLGLSNENHVPAGSPQGGEFASGGGASAIRAKRMKDVADAHAAHEAATAAQRKAYREPGGNDVAERMAMRDAKDKLDRARSRLKDLDTDPTGAPIVRGSGAGSRPVHWAGSTQTPQGVVDRVSPTVDRVHAAVAKRFGIPVESAKDLLTTPKEELRRRDAYVAPSNGTNPDTSYEKHPLGTAKIGSYGPHENSYVEHLREYDPKEVKTSETEQGIKQHPSYPKYVQWAKQGLKPPPISVAADKGTFVSSNRRRVLAGQDAGVKSIQGWHSPLNKETDLPLKYGDVLKAATEERAKMSPAVDTSRQLGIFSGGKEVGEKAAQADLPGLAIPRSEKLRRSFEKPKKDEPGQLTMFGLSGDIRCTLAEAAAHFGLPIEGMPRSQMLRLGLEGYGGVEHFINPKRLPPKAPTRKAKGEFPFMKGKNESTWRGEDSHTEEGSKGPVFFRTIDGTIRPIHGTDPDPAESARWEAHRSEEIHKAMAERGASAVHVKTKDGSHLVGHDDSKVHHVDPEGKTTSEEHESPRAGAATKAAKIEAEAHKTGSHIATETAVPIDEETARGIKAGHLTVPTEGGKIDPHLAEAYERHAAKQGHEVGEWKVNKDTGEATATLTPKKADAPNANEVDAGRMNLMPKDLHDVAKAVRSAGTGHIVAETANGTKVGLSSMPIGRVTTEGTAQTHVAVTDDGGTIPLKSIHRLHVDGKVAYDKAALLAEKPGEGLSRSARLRMDLPATTSTATDKGKAGESFADRAGWKKPAPKSAEPQEPDRLQQMAKDLNAKSEAKRVAAVQAKKEAAEPAKKKSDVKAEEPKAKEADEPVKADTSGGEGTGGAQSGHAEDSGRVAVKAEPSGDKGADKGGEDQREPAGVKPPKRIPAEIERVNAKMDRVARLLHKTGDHERAALIEQIKAHVNNVGVKDALESLGEDKGTGTTAQYEGAVALDRFGDFARKYLNRNGIQISGDEAKVGRDFSDPIERMEGAGPVVSTVPFKESAVSDKRKGDTFAAYPKLKDKLEEAKHLPGLGKTEAIPEGVTHLTPEVMAGFDQKFGKGKWVAKPYGENAVAGTGVLFPQRAERIMHDARNTIWDAGSEVAKHGFSLDRDASGKVVGLKHTGGDVYRFGSEKYNSTIGGDVRHWGDKAAVAAENEHGAALADGGKEYMVQPAFNVVGATDAERAAGTTWLTSSEGRVHVVTRNGKATAVPGATFRKQGATPFLFQNEDTRAMEKASEDSINSLPESERQGQIYAPDVVKTDNGYKVVEANPANEGGKSGLLGDNPWAIDAYVSHMTGQSPAHVNFIRNLLTKGYHEPSGITEGRGGGGIKGGSQGVQGDDSGAAKGASGAKFKGGVSAAQAKSPEEFAKVMDARGVSHHPDEIIEDARSESEKASDRFHNQQVLKAAKLSGAYIPPEQFKSVASGPNVGGWEHDVHFDKASQRFYKFNKGDTFGNFGDVHQYTRNAVALNKLAPDLDIKVHGVTRGANGQAQVVTSAAGIKGSNPSNEEVTAHLKSKGWKPVKGGEYHDGTPYAWKDPASGTKIHDTQGKNWIKTDSGKMVPIDIGITSGRKDPSALSADLPRSQRIRMDLDASPGFMPRSQRLRLELVNT